MNQSFSKPIKQVVNIQPSKKTTDESTNQIKLESEGLNGANWFLRIAWNCNWLRFEDN